MVSHKVAVSCAYFSAFFGLGLCLAVVGPSLLQLAANTGSGVDAIGSIFTWRAVGYLIGSVSGGQLFERLPGNPLLAIATLCCSIGTLFIPYCASLAALGLCTAVQGAAMGFLDTGGNVLLIRLWASEDDPSTADPYMQTMHFFFAVGAFVIPIIMDAYDQVGFAFAASFITISAYLLLVFLALVAVSWAEAAEKKAAHGGVGSVGTEKDAGKRKGPSARTVQEKWLFFSAGLLLFIYVGAESTYGGLVYTYSVTALGWTSSNGKAVTSIYWGGLAVGRLVAVPLSMKFSPVQLLFGDLLGCFVSALALLVFPRSDAVWWVMSGVYGLAMASIFPAVINSAAFYTTVDGPATSAMVVGASIGDMTIPLGTALFFVSPGPFTFPIIVFALTCGCVVALFGLFFAGRAIAKMKRNTTPPKWPGGGGEQKDIIEVTSSAISIVELKKNEN
jgi:MFS transporter, FHS family, Na+ dependent glucose transporter 1